MTFQHVYLTRNCVLLFCRITQTHFKASIEVCFIHLQGISERAANESYENAIVIYDPKENENTDVNYILLFDSGRKGRHYEHELFNKTIITNAPRLSLAMGIGIHFCLLILSSRISALLLHVYEKSFKNSQSTQKPTGTTSDESRY